MASWAVLKVSQMMGLPIHLIFGDSKVIISWLNRSAALDVPTLMHWCKDINNMLFLAPHVIFKHIYREHNFLADRLSKQALDMDSGHGYFSEHMDVLARFSESRPIRRFFPHNQLKATSGMFKLTKPRRLWSCYQLVCLLRRT